MSATTSVNRSVTLTHVYDAPREKVFKAWLEPEQIMRWFYASEGWTTPFAETDPKSGGAFRIDFASPDGTNDFVFSGIYNEVVAPERIVLTIADGRPVTVTFTERNGKTHLALDLTLENTHSEAQQREGWGAMLTHLAAHLASA